MNKLSAEDREFYGPSLDPLQINFVRDRVDQSKDLRQLILLVKSWNKDTFAVILHDFFIINFIRFSRQVA